MENSYLIFVLQQKKIIPIIAKKIIYYENVKYIDFNTMKNQRKGNYYKIDGEIYDGENLFDIYKIHNTNVLNKIMEYIKNKEKNTFDFVNDYNEYHPHPSYDKYVEHFCKKNGEKIDKSIINKSSEIPKKSMSFINNDITYKKPTRKRHNKNIDELFESKINLEQNEKKQNESDDIKDLLSSLL